jgi:hypothetical protein
MIGVARLPAGVLAALDLNPSGYSPMFTDPPCRFIRRAIAMQHNKVDHAVHLSGWSTVPALPAIVHSREGKAALRARRADRLFPAHCKAQPLCDFEDGNLTVDPLEIGQGC